MGRWSNYNDDGWHKVQRKSASRGRGNGNGGGNNGENNNGGGNRMLKDENSRLKSELQTIQRERSMATDRTLRPSARDTKPRDDDWLCAQCHFQSNRSIRGWCYRCAQPKADSFPPNSRHTCGTGGGAVAAGGVSEAMLPPADATKLLRTKLDKLQAGRAAMADTPGCDAQVQRLDQDIAAVRGQLTATLPVEVAVKGTLGPVAQARAAVQRAEAKLARIEGQVVALMAAHAAANTDLVEQRERLSAAEAATARAATAAVPHGELATALVSNPAAVWAALLTSIQLRVPGMPAAVVEQLNATTAAMQQACSLLPAQPVVALGGATAPAAADAVEPSTPAPPTPHAAQQQPQPQVNSTPPLPSPNLHLNPPVLALTPSSPSVQSQFMVDAAAASLAAGAAHDAATVTKQAEAAAAASAAAAAAQFQRQQQQEATAAAQYELERAQRHRESVAAASAAILAQSQAALTQQAATSAEDAIAIGHAASKGAADTPIPVDAAAGDNLDTFEDASELPPRADDSMCGTADDHVDRKRAPAAAQNLANENATARA